MTTLHDGPVFGPFSVAGDIDIVTGETWLQVNVDDLRVSDVYRTPQELAELAHAALEAARWLEGASDPAAAS